MEGAALPSEVYRLTGPNLEITYRRARKDLTVQIADPDLAQLSGNRVAPAAVEPDIGLRVDAELLFSRGGVKVILTLLVPEVELWDVEGQTAEVDAVAVITHVFKESVKEQPAQQSYDVRALSGRATLEV